MSQKITRSEFLKRCPFRGESDQCERYVNSYLPCDEACGYMVNEWAYYNREKEKERSPYRESLNYLTSKELSKIIEECNVCIPNGSRYAWVIDCGYKTLTPYDQITSNDSYYPAYSVTDVLNVVRDHYKIHINVFIDGGWTYSIEDFGNNELPILTEYAYDTFYDAVDVACQKVFIKLFNLKEDESKN